MTARDFKLDTSNNLTLTAGDFSLVSDGAAIVQSIRLRLGLFLGEWFLDLSEGIPYFQEVLIKNPNLAQIRSRFSDRIAGTPGVTSVEDMALTVDAANRTLSVRFKVLTDVGLLSDTATVDLTF